MRDDRSPTTSSRDGDLPVLDELGHDLDAAFRREERAQAARASRRRFRRVAVATAALFVVVPGAVATRSIWAPDPQVNRGAAFETARAVVVADGRGETLSWELSAYRDDGPCWQLSAFSATQSFGRASTCRGDVKGSPFTLSALITPRESVVFGWIAPEVARVEYTFEDQPIRSAQIVSVPADLARRAGVRPGLKGYVGTLRGDAGDAPVRAVAFDAAGRELGRFPPRR